MTSPGLAWSRESAAFGERSGRRSRLRRADRPCRFRRPGRADRRERAARRERPVGFTASPSDLCAEHPDGLRIITWQRLEHGDALNELGIPRCATRAPSSPSCRARAGVSTRFDPRILFALLTHIAMLWTASNPDVPAVLYPADRAEHRETIRRIAAALVE
ncbi:hypothetical protein PUR71_10025 [Streptomyces sp. SP17BM10]|uniref:hypothetical protein n=1 Tax=Streptomyces sp. SP17BM10 TaxID=3002530 RepID=UPI002E780BB0|nr:hypothetical protein [Streptomyces sp. SP17BM10]MEE1783248.1 hypothetical protein [Streptomyces sp. SP17BM10]